ncbi:MAG: BT_3928 family protein [Bacteroidota bacterium]
MKIIQIIARYLVGAVFIFSGFVKVIDPLGSTYKFTDYFQEAFGMDWMIPASFILALLMSVAEFIIGIALFFNFRVKQASWGALLFMIVFLPLTLYIAIYDPVQDCGCFGDALILSNWHTFYKNIIITILVLIVFFARRKYKPYTSSRNQWIIAACVFVFSAGLSLYCYHHLPLIDFRPYKVGTYLPDQMVIPDGEPTDVYMYDYTVRDSITGEEKVITSEEYINDTLYWWSGTTWEFISSSEPILVSRGYTPPIHDFSLTSQEGEDITDIVLEDENYTFLIIAYDLKKAKKKYAEDINRLYEFCMKKGYRFICMTSSINADIEKFRTETKAAYEFYTTDEITLKTIIRANPGLVLLRKGTVVGKWNVNDLPAVADFENDILTK